MSTRLRLCAFFVAWLLAAIAAAADRANLRAHPNEVRCVEEIPRHLWPRVDIPPVAVVGPPDEPEDPHLHDDGDEARVPPAMPPGRGMTWATDSDADHWGRHAALELCLPQNQNAALLALSSAPATQTRP